jgi:hypothetical protein
MYAGTTMYKNYLCTLNVYNVPQENRMRCYHQIVQCNVCLLYYACLVIWKTPPSVMSR